MKASASMEERAVGSAVKLSWRLEHCRALALLQGQNEFRVSPRTTIGLELNVRLHIKSLRAGRFFVKVRGNGFAVGFYSVQFTQAIQFVLR